MVVNPYAGTDEVVLDGQGSLCPTERVSDPRP
jgi:hypothetical protein